MTFIKRFQQSLGALPQLSQDAHYVVAYSGGIDSHVLLHCCCSLNLSVRAVHVHHGLQSMADDWVEHARVVCDALAIQLDVVYVDASKKQGQSPEESARIVRYEALQNALRDQDILLTAQHMDDQAETLLLQLFRTAGSAGLAAMPDSKIIGGNQHLRPLLGFSRDEIEAYANENALSWMEDPSNRDIKFDRNFIRLQLMPMLQGRWPGLVKQLSTVASLQSNNLQVLEDMAAVDLANAIATPGYTLDNYCYDVVSVLSIPPLKLLSSARLLNVLRYWIRNAVSAHAGSMPDRKLSVTRKLLHEIVKTLIYSATDANPVVVFCGFEFRKFRGRLYLLCPLMAGVDFTDIDWQPSQPLMLPALNCQLRVMREVSGGLRNDLLKVPLTVSFRKGGESFHPLGRRHSHSLKKLYQETNIPPWERDAIPILYLGDELIAVAGLWLAQRFAADVGDKGWLVAVDRIT